MIVVCYVQIVCYTVWSMLCLLCYLFDDALWIPTIRQQLICTIQAHLLGMHTSLLHTVLAHMGM
jgi:hypothetical protein